MYVDEKDFIRYPPQMKSGMKITNPNKFYHYHHDHNHDIKEYHALKKYIKDWSLGWYLQQCMKKEMQYKQT